MERNLKILVVVIVILVAGLSLTVGLLLGNYLNQPEIVNNTTNSTNNSSSQNNTTNSNQDQLSNTENKYISASQAISIAKSASPGDTSYFIITSPTPDYPYYQVGTNFSNGPDGHVTIDAVTGEVVQVMHGLGP